MQLEALSIADVSTRLGLSERTIHRLIAKGEMPSVRFGRRRLIPTAALAEKLAGNAGKRG